MMGQERKIENELWRADMYKLLALGFDVPKEKNRALLEEFLKDLTSSTLSTWSGGIIKPFFDICVKLYEIFKKERLDLLQEYNRLFVTETACPASEGSYHLAERGPILGDVTGFYEAFQIKFLPESGPPDSMKMELGFMHFLALKKVYALENGLNDAYQITEDAEKKFLNDHLGRWAELFVGRVNNVATLLFYQLMAILLKTWIHEECARLSITPMLLPNPLLQSDNKNCIRCPMS